MLISADLSAAVDVYADWMDACDAVAKDASRGAATERSANRTGGMPKAAADVDEGFIVDDERDAEGEYADDD